MLVRYRRYCIVYHWLGTREAWKRCVLEAITESEVVSFTLSGWIKLIELNTYIRQYRYQTLSY